MTLRDGNRGAETVNRHLKLVRFGAVVLCVGAWFGSVVAFSRAPATPAAPQRQAGPPSPTRTAAPGPARAPARVDYDAAVKAILAENCLECHSQDKRKGGLSLATYEDVLEGGRSGAVVHPGNSGRSLILDRITGAIEPQMPKDEMALGAEDIELIRLWIDQGARATPGSPPAPEPWEAPLALERPALPAVVWAKWQAPPDRFVASYLVRRKAPQPVLVPDAQLARRTYLDVWGLLPTPEELQAFVADRSPDKRRELVRTLLADNGKYADHWISFWNDLLRNEDGVTYFSENDGRKSITPWLYGSLEANLPYDEFVRKLLNPSAPTDPEGFLVGVNWRGETSAAVKPWMQASQNTAQIFLGVNLKCNSCHDSFVSKWKLMDAYALAAYFAPEPKLQLYRCDVAQEHYAEPGFLFPEVSRVPPSGSLADRRATAAAIFTDPRMGRLPRTLVNRVWTRLLGHGIVANSDEMDGQPWSPQLLDWLAADFVEHKYDVKHLIETILSSRAYQMPSVSRKAEPPARKLRLRGAGGASHDGRTVRRRGGSGHRRVGSGSAGRLPRCGSTERSQRARPGAVPADNRRDVRAELAGGVERPDARPGASGPGSGDLHTPHSVDDPTGTGAGERRDTDPPPREGRPPDAR